MKYVVIKNSVGRHAVLFGGTLSHADVAYGLKQAVGGEAVSAGFCDLEESTDSWENRYKVQAWGKSTSLGLGSSPEDVRDIMFAVNQR